MNVFGQGNVSAGRGRLRRLAEVGRQRRHAGIRRGAVHGRHLGRLRPRRVLDGRRRHVARAVVLAARPTAGPHGLRPAERRRRASASAAFRAASRTAARTCTSSRPCRRSTAATTSGSCSPSSTCRCGESELGAQRFELDVAGAPLRLLDERRNQLLEDGHQLPGRGFPAVPHDGVARRSRADVRRAVRRARRRRQHPGERDRRHPDRQQHGPLDDVPDHEHGIGNPDLTPEEADTVTAGFVVEPQQTRACSSRSTGTTSTCPTRSASSACNASSTSARLAPASQFCDYVFRDPGTNAVTAVRNPWLNINNARVRGLDYELLVEQGHGLVRQPFRVAHAAVPRGPAARGQHDDAGRAARDLSGQLSEPEIRARGDAALSARRVRRQLAAALLRRKRDQRRHDHVRAVRAGRRSAGSGRRSTTRPSTRRCTRTHVHLRPRARNGRSWHCRSRSRTRLDEDPPVIPTFDQRFSSQTNPANAYDVYGRRFL